MLGQTKLVLAFFESETAADRAAAALQQWDKATDDIKLGNLGVLVKDEHGKVKEEKLGPRTGPKGAGIGAVLGLVVAIPTGGLSLIAGTLGGGISGGALGTLFRAGLPKADVERFGAELEAGHAAVGVLVQPAEEARVTAKLAELGGSPTAHGLPAATLEQAEATALPPEDAPRETPAEPAEQTDLAQPSGTTEPPTTVTLTLDAEAARTLQAFMEQHLRDLRGEIGDTDDRELRAELHHDEAVLNAIVAQLAGQRVAVG